MNGRPDHPDLRLERMRTQAEILPELIQVEHILAGSRPDFEPPRRMCGRDAPALLNILGVELIQNSLGTSDRRLAFKIINFS